MTLSAATTKQASSMVGRVYLERGLPVTVLARWGPGGLRNVLIQRQSGEQVVRPFRGLRRPPVPDLVPAKQKKGQVTCEP